VLSHELAVEQLEPANFHPSDEPCQGDFGCVGHPAEHAFAEERAAQLYAVETAHELAVVLGLDRMRVTGRVER
jgi:hypothetical protein